MTLRWPPWWDWELELTPHIEKRMEERGFTDVDLRAMLHAATDWSPDHVEGRFVVASRLRQRPWSVIVEPDDDAQLLVVVTAYPVEDTP